MTDKEQAAAPSQNGGYALSGGFGTFDTYDDFAVDDDWPADTPTGLVSLAFLTAAIRRSALFCCIMALVGLLVGFGLYVKFPAPYQATTSVLLTYGPYENTNTAKNDIVVIAQTRTVAGLAEHKLGLRQDVSKFLAEYKATIVSPRVLLITFTARSASQALRGANAVATEFLHFRAGQLARAQALASAGLEQQARQASQQLSSLNAQIRRTAAQPSSAAQRSRLAALQSATTGLGALQTAVNTNKATNQPATAAAIKGSQVLEPAALLPRSHLKHLLLYPAAGLLVGLAVAIAIVLIRAIVSDRLWWRDDVANALGAPVKLSTGPLRPRRRRPMSRARRKASIQRIATFLGRAVPGKPQGVAALAVVAVDDPKAVALPLVSLAISCARQGQQVVLADLASRAPAARRLGAGKRSGVAEVRVRDARLVVAVPARNDVTPSGPLGHATAGEQGSPFTDAVTAACATADLLLTLVTLDPSLGGDHLPTWAADAVVVVTAGRSSWTKINAVGEMVRLSGARLVSAVIIGADKSDESLGAVATQAGRDTGIAEQGPNGDDPRLAADEGQGRHRSAAGDIPH